jgi:hypothetical protein
MHAFGKYVFYESEQERKTKAYSLALESRLRHKRF